MRTLITSMALLLFATVVMSQSLESHFANPPESSRPGVYWYFMDGNISQDGMTKDLESMKKAGIGNLVFLEVNVGVPRGEIDFLSDTWKQSFKHAVDEAERLGIVITLGVGPGWTGSGGPWVKAEQSMQHLVASSVTVNKAGKQKIVLAKPAPRTPFFGEGSFTPFTKQQWNDFYEDVAVLAFPTPTSDKLLEYIDEKALYYRAPYSSARGVKQYLPTQSNYNLPDLSTIPRNAIIDLTKNRKDSILEWNVPPGNWTIMRFGSRTTGSVTRPAPLPGVGLESDKFDTTAINAHLDHFVGNLFRTIKLNDRDPKLTGGLKMLHMDSWEMGAQNWTQAFRDEFRTRRGYDPLPFYPVYKGLVVDNEEVSERFLWDLRKTSQDLILEKHAQHIHTYAHKHGLGLSIEPYDMNPTADMELGAIADVPMAEFWSQNFGYQTAFSAIEASSLAHIKGQAVVPAEAFTAQDDGWAQYPGAMKNQTDWAFASGINRLVYHTFQHQCLPDNLRPGMTMGPYGVHWDRNQTWWPMVDAYHQYVSRSQFMLQQGRTVADILYLCPEVAPHVFLAPKSAQTSENTLLKQAESADGRTWLPDKKGYNFDACPPSLLYTATVKNKKIVFPSGASYHLLVLPHFETMTPTLLNKLKELVAAGATLVGTPPQKSPSLSNYPKCDQDVQQLVMQIWGTTTVPNQLNSHAFGAGRVISSKDMVTNADNLYPQYALTADILQASKIVEDFTADQAIRYTHRELADSDIYFLANTSDQAVTANCAFRITGKYPELWNTLTGEIRSLPMFSDLGNQTRIALEFQAHQSYFIVFKKESKPTKSKTNFPTMSLVKTLDAPWQVHFDPKWGGPEKMQFDKLSDWSLNANAGIKYYSGTAVYEQNFDLPANLFSKNKEKPLYLQLGKVMVMAHVWLNDVDLGVKWSDDWQATITKHVKAKNNKLRIEVVNLWINRLVGDEFLPDDGIAKRQWPDWLLNGTPRTSGRYTFSSHRHYSKDTPLSASGLLGPVSIFTSN